MSDDLKADIVAALSHRLANGRHLHHSACIHNLPPEKQIETRGRTVEWWTAMVGPLPTQITSDDWECEPPVTDTAWLNQSPTGTTSDVGGGLSAAEEEEADG